MNRKWLIWVLAVSVLLSGCGQWPSGHYYSAEPHQAQSVQSNNRNVSAENYTQLREAVGKFVESGDETALIAVPDYDQAALEKDIETAVKYVMEVNPIGAYAVDDISYELGTNAGQPALSLNISYRHGASEIKQIRKAVDDAAAKEMIELALELCNPSIVIQIANHTGLDFVQVVEDYAFEHPDLVMEQPEVNYIVYPQSTGFNRVVEVKFTYQTGRDDLRNMQSRVAPVFSSAMLYVSGDGAQREKFSQLYSFLMERFDYKFETSITPAYSLLRHGVGDCRAFATVYAAMCSKAGLDCLVVYGARDGQPWYWNLVCIDGQYYHVDLLRCAEQEKYEELPDEAMTGYVWDYYSFPACPDYPPEATDPTVPEETTVDTEENN